MFDYTTDIIDNLEKSISLERLSTYIREVEGDKAEALRLYLWNSEVSAAFYSPLQCLEISLRNALHRELTEMFGGCAWYNEAPLNDIGQKKVEQAKAAVRKFHERAEAPHVVAELSFGFWLSLFNKRYHQTLWIPGLSKAFPHAHMKRADILRELDHLRTFRNRIAHHEPIFKRHLEKDYQSILTSIRWICPDTAEWAAHHHIVDEILSRKPA